MLAFDGGSFKVRNPAIGERLADCAKATKEDVDAAVKSALAAFPEWKTVDSSVGSKILLDIADAIETKAEHLTAVESMDNRKSIRETSALDVPLAVDHFRYFAEVIRSEDGSASVLDGNILSIVLHESIGVVEMIVPWNFPFLIVAWKLAPALAAGTALCSRAPPAPRLAPLSS